jgi:hypothetical protein
MICTQRCKPESPIAIYRKDILGKVFVTVLNPFMNTPEGVLLQGNDDDSYVELFDNKSLAFFERVNRDHIRAGRLTKVKTKPVPEPSPNIISDDEIDVLLDGKKTKFLALKAKVTTFTEEAPVKRLLDRARELDKSDKLVTFLEQTLSDLQVQKYKEFE